MNFSKCKEFVGEVKEKGIPSDWRKIPRGLKDHEIQQMVSEIRDATKPMIPHQCLREVIGKAVTGFLAKKKLRFDHEVHS